MKTYEVAEKILNSVSPSFCLAKWHFVTLDLATGSVAACPAMPRHQIPSEKLETEPHRLVNTPHLRERWLEMLAGQRPKECQMCWDMEALGPGAKSERIRRSIPRMNELPRTLRAMRDQKPIIPETLEILFSSSCHFKCVYCSASNSSSWAKEVEAYGPYELGDGQTLHQPLPPGLAPTESNIYKEAFWRWWPELKTGVRRIKITGGEPLLHRDLYDFLNRLPELAQPLNDFCVNTNLGVPESLVESFLERIQTRRPQINKFTLQTSMEAVGGRAEYIRFGLNFELWRKNLLRCLQSPAVDQVVVNSVLNVLSLPYFREYLEFAAELSERLPGRLTYSCQILSHPDCLSLVTIPEALIANVADAIGFADAHPAFDLTFRVELRNSLRMLAERCLNEAFGRQNQLRAYMREIDRRRALSAEATFPELFRELNLMPPQYQDSQAQTFGL